MQNLLVQVTNRYLCLTACEPVGGVDETQNAGKNKSATVDKRAYSFSSPFIITLDSDVLKDKETVWEDPVLFARLVADGLTQMGHGEVKNVTLVLDNFDLTTQEYQHGSGSRKVLDNMAIERIREFVGERVSDYSVISKDYAALKGKNDPASEVTAKAFAIPKPLLDDLSAAFKSYSLELIKVVPSEIAMLYAAHKTVTSYNRTVALVSMDYCAVRIMLIKGGETLYCHDFRSPIIDMLQVIEEDRGIDTAAAIDYVRTVGYGFKDDCRSAQAQRKIEEIAANTVDDIIHNIRLVVMSLDIAIDQMLLSDFLAYIPHIRNYFLSFGLCKDIQFISDTFNNASIMPEPSIRARDNFYKAGSFFIFNELMNSGDVFKDNLIYGLKASVAKSVDAGAKIAKIFCFAILGLIVAGFGVFGFFKIRESMDKDNFEDTKWNDAKSLIQRTEELESALKNQRKDIDALPRTKFYTTEIIDKLDKQVVSAVSKFDAYQIAHVIDENTNKEVFSVPISGLIESYNAFVKLQNSINSHNFFTMNPTFSFSSDEESSKFAFATTVTAVQPDTKKDDSAAASDTAESESK